MTLSHLPALPLDFEIMTSFGTGILCSFICGFLCSSLYMGLEKDDADIKSMSMLLTFLPVFAAVLTKAAGYAASVPGEGLALCGICILLIPVNGLYRQQRLFYLLMALCGGFLCGTGWPGLALLITILSLALRLILEKAGWGYGKEDHMILRIWMPESMPSQGVFEEVFDTFARDYKLILVRTTEFGSVCELRYRIRLKADTDHKALLDEIRKRNGNMNVTLITAPNLIERDNRQIL